LSVVIAVMSCGLDLAEGQPMGHSARACAVGMRIGEALGLTAAQRSDLLYAGLLKDAGCSANAAQVAELYGADDLAIKRERKLLDQHRPRELAGHLLSSVAPEGSPLDKFGRLAALVRHGAEGSRRLTELRCEAGAAIVRVAGLSEETASAIRALDEHWDGKGHPGHLAGEAIPLLGRILCLSQTAEVYARLNGPSYACAMARTRSGAWFDPDLVTMLSSFEEDDAFWAALDDSTALPGLVAALEPPELAATADDDALERLALAFGRVVDVKSPNRAGHSERVADLVTGAGAQLGLDAAAVRDLRRAALLADLGMLGISNRILDKAGELRLDEWRRVRRHPETGREVLGRIAGYAGSVGTAAAHHERLDGTGYPLGLHGSEIGHPARLLAVADVFAALTADRAWRGALAPKAALAEMRDEVPHRLDADAVAALEAHLARAPSPA